MPLLPGKLLRAVQEVFLDVKHRTWGTRKIQAPLWTKVHENLIM
nr:MAG TPA: hypothetical protein [Caudoviricetes sp.]